jgi:hypothetical protein
VPSNTSTTISHLALDSAHNHAETTALRMFRRSGHQRSAELRRSVKEASLVIAGAVSGPSFSRAFSTCRLIMLIRVNAVALAEKRMYNPPITALSSSSAKFHVMLLPPTTMDSPSPASAKSTIIWSRSARANEEQAS